MASRYNFEGRQDFGAVSRTFRIRTKRSIADLGLLGRFPFALVQWKIEKIGAKTLYFLYSIASDARRASIVRSLVRWKIEKIASKTPDFLYKCRNQTPRATRRAPSKVFIEFARELV